MARIQLSNASAHCISSMVVNATRTIYLLCIACDVHVCVCVLCLGLICSGYVTVYGVHSTRFIFGDLMQHHGGLQTN